MSNHKGKSVAQDFLSCDRKPKIVRRITIRAFIYDCIYIDEIFNDSSKKNINIVMQRFNLKQSDRIKVQKIMNRILKRDKKLPPIIDDSMENYLMNEFSSRKLKAICY